MAQDDFVAVGGPLSPAAAGFLEYELAQRGIASRLRFGEEDDRQQVEVAPGDLEAALAVRAATIGEEEKEAGARDAPDHGRRHRLRNATLASVLGLVAVLRVGRLVHTGVATALAALAVAAAVFLGVLAHGADAGDGGDDAPRGRRYGKR